MLAIAGGFGEQTPQKKTTSVKTQRSSKYARTFAQAARPVAHTPSHADEPLRASTASSRDLGNPASSPPSETNDGPGPSLAGSPAHGNPRGAAGAAARGDTAPPTPRTVAAEARTSSKRKTQTHAVSSVKPGSSKATKPNPSAPAQVAPAPANPREAPNSIGAAEPPQACVGTRGGKRRVGKGRRRHLLAHPPVSSTAFGPTRTHATQPNRIRPRLPALGRIRPHSAAPSAPHRIRPRTAAPSPGRPPPAAFHRARTHSHAFARCARPSHSHAAALGRTTPDPARPAHAFARSRTHLARAPHEPRTPPAADRARSAALR